MTNRANYKARTLVKLSLRFALSRQLRALFKERKGAKMTIGLIIGLYGAFCYYLGLYLGHRFLNKKPK